MREDGDDGRDGHGDGPAAPSADLGPPRERVEFGHIEPLDTGVWITVDIDTVRAIDQQYHP